MTDMGETVQDQSGAKYPATDAPQKGEDRSTTAGTDRDYDDSEESTNQGHGHPRDRQDPDAEPGHSEKEVSDADRSERDLGGPGG